MDHLINSFLHQFSDYIIFDLIFNLFENQLWSFTKALPITLNRMKAAKITEHRTCINKDLHVHEVTHSRIMKDKNSFQNYDIGRVHLHNSTKFDMFFSLVKLYIAQEESDETIICSIFISLIILEDSIGKGNVKEDSSWRA